MTSVYELSACKGKKTFPDMATAEFVRRRSRKDLRLQPYRCRACGKLHLGTSVKTQAEGESISRARLLHEIRAKEAVSDAWSHA